MATNLALVQDDDLAERVMTVRGARVMIDVDLARVYGVSVKRLNEQVKRNQKRFLTTSAFDCRRKRWRV